MIFWYRRWQGAAGSHVLMRKHAEREKHPFAGLSAAADEHREEDSRMAMRAAVDCG